MHDKKSFLLYSHMNNLYAKILTKQNLLEFESAVEKLNVKEINIIRYLGIIGESKMKDIAAKLHIIESTLTGIVDGLVKNKLAQRNRSEKDRRIVTVCLTDLGKDMNNEILEKHLELYDHMLETLSVEEQDTLIKLFSKISEKY